MCLSRTERIFFHKFQSIRLQSALKIHKRAEGQYGTMGKECRLWSLFRAKKCHTSAIWYWASHLTSLSSVFLIYKIGILIPTSGSIFLQQKCFYLGSSNSWILEPETMANHMQVPRKWRREPFYRWEKELWRTLVNKVSKSFYWLSYDSLSLAELLQARIGCLSSSCWALLFF